MKHQLSLRRLLLYVALFAVGFGLVRFALISRIEGPLPQIALFFGTVCVSLPVFRLLDRLMINKNHRDPEA